MKKALLDVLFASDKRKQVLLLLQEGQKETKLLLKSLDTTREALLPQMKILKEHHLVSHYEDTYELTTVGKILVDEMVLLLGTTNLFDNDIDYWGTRKLDFIPPHLLKRIKELNECQVINPAIQDLYALPQEFYGTYDLSAENSRRAETFYGVTAFFYPNAAKVFTEMLHGQVEINLIVTQDMADKVQGHDRADYAQIVKNELFHLFVYPQKIDFISFGFNEHCLLMRLLNSSGNYDYMYVLSSSQSALKWGKELFEYYLKDSVPVPKI